MRQIPLKAWLLTLAVIFSNVFGNLFLSLGMKQTNSLAETLLSPLVILGVTLLIVWMLTRMTLMSWADLSYILPVTSAGYILSALAGKFFLGEQISGSRWWGTVLIFSGMLVVSRTPLRTK